MELVHFVNVFLGGYGDSDCQCQVHPRPVIGSGLCRYRSALDFFLIPRKRNPAAFTCAALVRCASTQSHLTADS